MTDFEAYQEYIQCKHNAFCKAVIRYAARDKILQLRRKWERQISLDYLMDEKFVQFAGPEPDEEYPFTVCGQTVLLCNAALAAALSAQPKQTQEVILRYYFLRQPQRVIGAHIGRTRSTAGRHIQLAFPSTKGWFLPDQSKDGLPFAGVMDRYLLHQRSGRVRSAAESSIPSSRRPDEPPVSAMSCSCSRSICGLDNRIIWQVPRKPVGSFQ